MTDLRKRDWCFTLNNYTTEEFEYLNSLSVNDGLIYMIVGKECGESGTKHLQGYIYFKSAKTMSAVKKYLKTDRVHLEIAKGTPQQAADYCKKEKDFFFLGELPSQGKRTDLENVKQLLKETNKMSEVVLQATSYQSVRMAETILKYHEKKRNWKPMVRWFYGTSGSGKTKTAHELLGEECYVCMSSGKWFEGYDAHEKVLIDDLRHSFMSFENFIKLIDRYAYRVECKGGSRQFLAKEIIITSPYPPEYIWASNGEDKKQLLRRIDEIREFVADGLNSCDEV